MKIVFIIITRIVSLYEMNLAIKEKNKGNTLDAIYWLIWALIMLVISL